jgi:hypothetical protein
MAKFIGVKMIEATPMRASMALSAGYKIGNAHPDDIGYEVTYPDGYKSWSPAKEFEKAYYKLEDPAGDVLKENDIKRFIKDIENVKVGTKTTNTTLTCLTGFEVMAIRNIPVIRSINRVLDLPNNNSYYKLDENILSIISYKDIAKDIFE